MHKVKLSLVYTFCEDVWKIFSIEMLKATAGVSCLQINTTTPHKKRLNKRTLCPSQRIYNKNFCML